jgi:hypothetical protein
MGGVTESAEDVRADEARVSRGGGERPGGVQPIQSVQKAVAVLNLFTPSGRSSPSGR